MNQIARQAGLAKGTLYLYFKTKEEIFLELLLIYVCQWVDGMAETLTRKEAISQEEAISILLESVKEYDSLRKLLVLYASHLNANMSSEQAESFYRQLTLSMKPLLEKLPFGKQNVEVLLQLYALTMGWHLVLESEHNARISRALDTEMSQFAFENQVATAFRAVVGNMLK